MWVLKIASAFSVIRFVLFRRFYIIVYMFELYNHSEKQRTVIDLRMLWNSKHDDFFKKVTYTVLNRYSWQLQSISGHGKSEPNCISCVQTFFLLWADVSYFPKAHLNTLTSWFWDSLIPWSIFLIWFLFRRFFDL